jgi:hypothetical protein
MDAAAPGNVVYGWGPTFLGAPHDNLPAEQGLKAGGGTKYGQGPLAYPCSSEACSLALRACPAAVFGHMSR